MANTTYTVVGEDTLTKIASKFNTTVANLVKLNDIDNPDLIFKGQVLIVSGTATTTKTNTTSKAVIKHFGLQADTDRTVFATWTWDKSNTDKYQVRWKYYTSNGVWFIGSDTTVTAKESTYNAPQNAERVSFHVKPISKTKKVKNKETAYWTADWSTTAIYNFANNPPSKPSTPKVEIEKYVLTASLDNVDNLNAKTIQFKIYRDDSATVYKTGTANIITGRAAWSYTVGAGHRYKVRCRAGRDGVWSDWSEYSDNVDTIPAAPGGITSCKAKTKTSIYLKWSASTTADTYDIEYATKKEYFDKSDETTIKNGIAGTEFEVTGLESGSEYFFRVRAVNEEGESGWSEIKSATIGTTPIAPTTWSSTTTAISGEDLKLYWVHNSEDGSTQTSAQLELIVNGSKTTTTIPKVVPEDEEEETSVYTIDTTQYVEGTTIQWRVKTAGVTGEYGDWSVQRKIDVYAPPTLQLTLTDSEGNEIEQLTEFPIKISGIAGPTTQSPIGYHVSITANEAYETVDSIGNVKMVNANDVVYSKFFDTSTNLNVDLSAGELDLENNVSYTLTCIVTMNSGLNGEASSTFTVAWTDNVYEPNAEIVIDQDTLAAHIRPYCEDEFGALIEGITLSVYRREFDGSFVEIATGIPNDRAMFVTDPHPALDFARYRIVAITDSTGGVSYCDLAGLPVGEIAVVIQWDEAWSNFETSEEEDLAEPAWSGSMLKLPYNIDVSDSNNVDLSLVEYIGRKHPVNYHGTQLGNTSSWKVVIEADDKETLYALRRLAIWMDKVYVREPSGTGYWATIAVSYDQKHCDPTIPVRLEITRVEGGM